LLYFQLIALPAPNYTPQASFLPIKALPLHKNYFVTGGDWKFLKLEKNKVTFDIETYYLVELPKILGIFHQIIQKFL
jgi:hypothetical protein